jgi:hypothetical protein
VKCEVEIARNETIKLGEDMERSIRKLRRALKKCKKCDHFDDCQILKNLNSQIQAALESVIDEWGL